METITCPVPQKYNYHAITTILIHSRRHTIVLDNNYYYEFFIYRTNLKQNVN